MSARVLFDGTHGLSVNTKTRLRDQERAPIAADLKRSMREKAKVGELTFALSADVTEADRLRYIQMIGTSLGAKLSLAVTYSKTRWGLSASHRRLIIGPGSLAPLDDYSSISLVTSWHMLVADDYLSESPGVLATVLGFFYSSCSVLSLAYHYHGIRRVGGHARMGLLRDSPAIP